MPLAILVLRMCSRYFERVVQLRVLVNLDKVSEVHFSGKLLRNEVKKKK